MRTVLKTTLTAVLSGGLLLSVAGAQDVPRTAVPKPDKPQPDSTQPDRTVPDKEGTEAPRRGHEAVPAPTSEADFVQKAATGGNKEVKLAQLGVKKASRDKVKELARTLVKDHTAANEQLKSAAKKANHSIDETPDPKAEEKYAELSKMEGESFDTAFLEEMAMCHQKGIGLFEAGRKVATSEGVVTFIDSTLPVLREHATQIKTLQPGTRPDATNPDTTPEPRPGTTSSPPRKPEPNPQQ